MTAWYHGHVWTWRGTDTGGRWLGWSPLGVVLLVSVLVTAPLVWLFEWWALLAVSVVAAAAWERVGVDAAGVSWIRGLGPIPWAWRRLPPGGEFIVYARVDAERATEVAYRIAGVEHVLASCGDPARVRALLAEAAGRAANPRS